MSPSHRGIPPSRRLRTALLAALSAALLGLLLAACGSSSSPGTSATANAQETAVKFARCLREHGINASIPSGSAQGALVRVTGSGAGGQHAFEAAQIACKRYQPAPPKITPAEQTAHAEAALKFAKCMRSHGVDIPNPNTSGGGVKIQIGGPGGGPNPSSATFQAAQRACQSDLQFKGLKGAFPAGGPPPGAPPKGGPGQKFGAVIRVGG